MCEEGYIKGISQGYYTRSKKNKAYALKAVELIKENKQLVDKPDELWKQLTNDSKKHNGQMFVVCELFKHGLIVG